jgi:uncharacterized membrane protein
MTASAPPSPRTLGTSPAQPSVKTRLQFSTVVTILVLFALFTPWPLQEKLHSIGRACCAQIPGHTISFAGQLMPLDARNTGIYSGVFVVIVLLWLTGRQRAALFAPLPVTLVLLLATLSMIVDGFNSLLENHHWPAYYHDTNTLRVITGAFSGMALTILVVPVFNRLVWRKPEPIAIAEDLGELAGYVGATLVLILTLLRMPRLLYYPLSLLSIAGLLTTLVMVNTCIFIVSLRRMNTINNARALVLPALGALAFTCFEIMAVDLWRNVQGY